MAGAWIFGLAGRLPGVGFSFCNQPSDNSHVTTPQCDNSVHCDTTDVRMQDLDSACSTNLWFYKVTALQFL